MNLLPIKPAAFLLAAAVSSLCSMPLMAQSFSLPGRLMQGVGQAELGNQGNANFGRNFSRELTVPSSPGLMLPGTRGFGRRFPVEGAIGLGVEMLNRGFVDNRYPGEPVYQEPQICPITGRPIGQPAPPTYTPAPTPAPAATRTAQPTVSGPREMVERAKQHFRAGEFAAARDQIEAAIEQIPDNNNLLQFRSATYFAEGKYAEAAADAYDAIKLGNLWNWKAMHDVYRNPDLYTEQLRQLEASCKQDEVPLSSHFLLAYHYLVLEHLDHGAKHLRAVLEIEPEEEVSRQLLAVVTERQSQE